MERVARCYCGQLRLTIMVEPVHVHLCTCTRCQNATGSVGGWNGWFPKAGVTVAGEVTRFGYDRTGGAESWQCFCPVCGSGGYGVTGEFLPDCYVVPMGSFASPEGPQVPGPRMVHHWANRPRWVDHIGELPGAGAG